MNCPHCNQYAPDNDYICPQCGKALQPEGEPIELLRKANRRSDITTNIIVALLVALGIGIFIYVIFFNDVVPTGELQSDSYVSAAATAPNASIETGEVINSNSPGQELDIQVYVKTGQTTIFDFYSEYCGPCRRISPLLKKLDSQRQDIAVHKVDINRPGVRGIDWKSPVARQYKLKSIPHFVIYDDSGRQAYEGKVAYTEVMKLLQSEQLSK